MHYFLSAFFWMSHTFDWLLGIVCRIVKLRYIIKCLYLKCTCHLLLDFILESWVKLGKYWTVRGFCCGYDYFQCIMGFNSFGVILCLMWRLEWKWIFLKFHWSNALVIYFEMLCSSYYIEDIFIIFWSLPLLINYIRMCCLACKYLGYSR